MSDAQSATSDRPLRVLFVCMGNICRSPMAEGAFRQLVVKAGLAERVTMDSAGTHEYHVGEAPDPRAQRAAGRRGYDIGALRGRQVRREDFSEFDFVLAMDELNLRLLRRLCPPQFAHRVRLFMEFGDPSGPREVPDPYYGGTDGFDRVLDMVERAGQGLLDHLRQRLPGEAR